MVLAMYWLPLGWSIGVFACCLLLNAQGAHRRFVSFTFFVILEYSLVYCGTGYCLMPPHSLVYLTFYTSSSENGRVGVVFPSTTAIFRFCQAVPYGSPFRARLSIGWFTSRGIWNLARQLGSDDFSALCRRGITYTKPRSLSRLAISMTPFAA